MVSRMGGQEAAELTSLVDRLCASGAQRSLGGHHVDHGERHAAVETDLDDVRDLQVGSLRAESAREVSVRSSTQGRTLRVQWVRLRGEAPGIQVSKVSLTEAANRTR